MTPTLESVGIVLAFLVLGAAILFSTKRRVKRDRRISDDSSLSPAAVRASITLFRPCSRPSICLLDHIYT